jgi:ComF family protein
MRFFLERLFQFFLPHPCPCCEKFLTEGSSGICSDCLAEIHWVEPPFCTVCGTPFLSKVGEAHACGSCLVKKRYFTTARALGYYEGPLQQAIHRWKYEGRTSLTVHFGEWLAAGLPRYWPSHSFDLLIPVPLHVRRLRERGFNQALLLVKELSRHTGIPFHARVLQKKRHTLPQVDLSRAEREREIKGVFHVLAPERVEKKTILLVDDVYTTGATVNECSRALLAAGAQQVDVLTVAHAIKMS